MESEAAGAADGQVVLCCLFDQIMMIHAQSDSQYRILLNKRAGIP